MEWKRQGNEDKGCQFLFCEKRKESHRRTEIRRFKGNEV